MFKSSPSSGLQPSERYSYCPRRQLSAVSSSPPSCQIHTSASFIILFREPGSDRIPKYVIRDIRDTSENPPLLRVSLFDITEYVSLSHLEKFENGRFATNDFDFPSFRTWLKEARQEMLHEDGVYYHKPRLLPKCPHVHITISPSELSAKVPKSAMDMEDMNGTASYPSTHTPTPFESEGMEFEVSHVLEYKDVLGRRYHLVAWKNLPPDRATWLTTEELQELGMEETSSDTSSDHMDANAGRA